MCDYSLFQFPNRLARDGEELIAYQFSSGCLGFVSAAEFGRTKLNPGSAWFERNWPGLKSWFLPRLKSRETAVCIAPGSCLRLSPVAVRLRERYGLGCTEQAVFMQKGAEEFTYRDALRFESGLELSLQSLIPGQRVHVTFTPAREQDSPEQFAFSMQ